MYKFSKLHEDIEIQKIQQEAQDNFASQSDVGNKIDKLTSITTSEPTLISLSNGEQTVYYDGSNVWIYQRIGSKLFKHQLTEV